MIPCIPKDLIEKIKGLNLDVSTQERIKLFNQFFDEQTSYELSKAFEHNMTLKNQENAYNKFIDSLSDVGQTKKAELKQRLAKELQRKRELIYNSDGSINPNFEALAGRSDAEIEAFVKKTLDNKYDIALTPEQTKTIVDMKGKVEEAKKLPMKDDTHYSDAYGKAVNDMATYLGDIQNPTQKMKLLDEIKTNFKNFQNETKQLKG